ncbi:MAG: choice-of-anchor D domain-containing protein [Acidobacteriia bacterium]|nr:choice-of-anchor D domain-containing protein [Terriglobia bacterium]
MSRGRAECARPVRAAETVMCFGAAIKTVLLSLLGLGIFLHTGLAEAQQNPPNPASRPILFVYGFCGDATGDAWNNLYSWDNLYNSLIGRLDPTLYPHADPKYVPYRAWYDAGADQVFFQQGVTPVPEALVPYDARFFIMTFYDPVNKTFNIADVANISILNKAYELSRVIKRITAITHIKDVIVIAHSQGGLVARAYMENLASKRYCYARYPFTGFPDYDNGVCAPGEDDAFYAYDTADLITLDTPNAGTPLATFELPPGVCSLSESVNRTELQPESTFLQALNYAGTIANKSADKNPQSIHALYSYYPDSKVSWTDPAGTLGFSDDIVGIESQKITPNLPSSESLAHLEDLSNPLDSSVWTKTFCWPSLIGLTPGPIPHLNRCLGFLQVTQDSTYFTLVPPPPKALITPGQLTSIKVQATLNGQAWPPPGSDPQPLSYTLFGSLGNSASLQPGSQVPQTFSDLPLGEYQVTNIGPGPGTLSWPILVSGTSVNIPSILTSTLGSNFSSPTENIDGNVWSLTFTLNFISSPPLAPAVTTSAASNLQCDTATLNGTVNLNVSAASVYFEFGTDSQLSNFTQTAVQTVPTGTAPVSFSAVKTGLACNTIYYYRAVASNGPTPVRATNILSFTTLSTLPAPTLIAPANGSTGVALQPTFSWSAVPGATSGYRLIIATTPSALPTDPTDPNCGAGCVLNWPPSGSFTGNSFTPPAGTLLSGTVYYWEVHGRNPYQYGNWSLPVASFTTASDAGAGDFSVNISPTSETIVAGGSVTFAVTTSTISGSPQSLALNVSNLPANAKASFDQSTVISGRTAFLTIATSSNTPPGSYTLFLSAVGSAGAHVATTTLVVNGSGPTAEAPAVTTDSAGAITSTSAVLNGALNPNGSAALGWFQYGTDPSFGTYQETANQNVAADNLSHNFSASVSGLTPGSTYYYRAVASNIGGRNQGSSVSFTTTSSTYTLSVSASGGTVTSSDGGINCPGSCSHQYPNGAFVTLTANPPIGSVLLNWSGTCTGDGQCVIAMTQDQSVTAIFLSGAGADLTAAVNGNGTVSSSDGNVNCTSTTCTYFYPANTPVTLTANPLLGNTFTGWGGACTGNGSCVLSMAHNTLVEATFTSASGNTAMALSPGTMLTVAGNGMQGYAGDQGPASGAEMYFPLGVSVDRDGNVFLADFDNNRIRLVNTQASPITVAGVAIPPGAIATIVGTGVAGSSGDGGPPNSAQIWGPIAVALDAAGNLYLSDANNDRIRVVNLQSNSISVFGVSVAPGTIQTVAGNGTQGYSGDGGPATSAALAIPQGFAFDPAGNLLIADWANQRIRRVDKNTGVITTFAGGGANCAQRIDGLGDGCLAVNSTVTFPTAVAIDSFGNIFIADGLFRIRVIYQGGNVPGLSNPQTQHIYTLAGAGSGCAQQTNAAGDGCASTDVPGIVGEGLALDRGGSLYIADSSHALLRRLDRVTGIVTTVAGNGTVGYSGDGGGATSGALAFDSFQYGSIVTADNNGNLYFSDSSNNRVREVLAAAAPLNFQETNVGSTSVAQRLLLENSGTAILSVPTIAVSGPDPNDFSESNTCNSSIQPGGSCTILVTYTPSHAGNSTATLAISSSNATNSPQSVALNGTTLSSTATALTSSLNPATALSSVTFTATVTSSQGTPNGSVTFTDGPITLGTGAVDAFGVATWSTSSLSAGTHSIAASYGGDATYASSTAALAQVLQPALPVITWAAPAPIISGTALSALQLNATASVAGTFIYNPAAGTVLGAGPQTVSVTFTPTDTTDYSVATATVSLIVTYPAITVAPSIGNFVDQPVGTASPGTTFTIHSSGTAELTLQPITLVSGQVFHVVANSCGASLAAGDSCTVSVTFNPAVGGPASDSLQINSNASPAVLTLPLQGTGITPFASLSVNSVNFGSQPIASATANTVTLTNFGAAALSGIAISIAGANPSDFSYQADGCLGTTLVTHSSCLITVTFSPQATGLRSATLAISDNAPGSPQIVSLTGTGSTVPLVVTRQGTGNGTVMSSDGSISCGVTCSANFNSGTIVTLTATPASGSVFTGWGGACSGTQPCSVTMNAAQSVIATFIPGVPTGDLSATSLVFGSQLVGVVSPVQVVTLSNSGNASLGITSIALAGPNASDFSQNNTCGLALAAGASCTISIVFTPSASGPRTASVTLTDSLGVQNITLTGTGIAPAISFSPAALTFPSQLVGTSSTSQAITVQNTGTASLPMTSVVLGGANAGDFSQTNTCGTSLAAGMSCTVSVIFTPSSFGNKTATLVLTDSVGTQSVDVSGTGTAALAALSPASLAFPNQPVGTPSAAQVISLANGGNIALSVASISLTGVNSSDFAQTNTCGTSVAAGSSCTINVVFTPSSAGSKSASIAVVDSVGTQTATVGGSGTAPAVNLSSSNLIFANQTVGTSSTAQAVTLTNSGNGTLSISSISISGANSADFAQTNTCGTSLAAGANCTISITFVPTVAGTRTAAVTIVDNAGTQSISLTGTGVAAGPAVQLTPTSLSFGVQPVGVSSSVRTINVANTGGSALSITSVSVAGTSGSDFIQTNTCGTSVGAGGTCTISVTFKPAAAGLRSAAITLQDGVGTQTVPLDGIGQAPLTFSPTSIAFSNQALGSTSGSQIITLTNNTGVLVSFSSIAVIGTNAADFVQLSTTCGQTLALTSSCTVTLEFAPTATGTRTAALTITDDATNNPQSVALSGSGILPVTVTASISFGTQKVGTTSQNKSVTIKNNLPTPLTFSTFSFGGTNPGDFRQSATTCGSTLAAGANCTVSIVFSPTAPGSRSAVFNVADNAITSPQSVALTGTGK